MHNVLSREFKFVGIRISNLTIMLNCENKTLPLDQRPIDKSNYLFEQALRWCNLNQKFTLFLFSL